MRLVLAAFLALAFPASAQDMTDAERDAFRAEVRAYLLENPEVIMEAIGVLEAREQQARVNADVQMARANQDSLFNDPTSFVGGNPDGDTITFQPWKLKTWSRDSSESTSSATPLPAK